MPSSFITLTGDKRLNAKLARLSSKDAKALIRRAARPALKPVLGESRRLSPKREGTLRRSLAIRAIKRSRRQVGARVTTKEGLFQGATFYGGFIEWGWRTKGNIFCCVPLKTEGELRSSFTGD